MHHLDGVDDHHSWLLLLGQLADLLHAGFGDDTQLVIGQMQTAGTHGHLLQRLFAGHIEHLHLLGQLAHGLQQQGTLARPWMAANQDGRAWDYAAAQHPIQLAKSGSKARDLGERHLSQGLDTAILLPRISAQTRALAGGGRA